MEDSEVTLEGTACFGRVSAVQGAIFLLSLANWYLSLIPAFAMGMVFSVGFCFLTAAVVPGASLDFPV